MRVVAVIGGVLSILFEVNRIGELLWLRVDRDLDAHRSQLGHDLFVKRGYRLGFERKRFPLARAGADLQFVVDEIELYFKRLRAVRNRRGGQPARADIQGNIPPMVQLRAERKANFSGNLRPELE